MSNDVENMFASLSEDAALVRLDGPATLRRRSDRQVAVRSVATVAAAAVLVTGIAVGTRFVLANEARPPMPPAGSTAPSLAPTPTPSVTTPAPVTTSSAPPPSSKPPVTAKRPPIPGSIPVRAFLSKADYNAYETPRSDDESPALPDLCGATFAQADVGIRDNRISPYWRAGAGESETLLAYLNQTITVFRKDGAEAFVDELRAAVADCPSQKRNRDTWRYRLLTPVDAGDESLLIEASFPGRGDNGELDPNGSRGRYYCAVVRVGDSVTTLWATGWEGQSPDRTALGGFTRKAADRLQDWRG